MDNMWTDKPPIVLDGGLSNVLEELGCDLNTKLWTAGIIDKDPEAVIDAHLLYLKSGAQCITTASYQASIPGLIAMGYSEENAEALLIKSVQLAEIAVERATEKGFVTGKPLIAASVGPYGAYLADGSEYRGNYGVPEETLRTFHREKINILDRTGADILACETIPDHREAKVLAEILDKVDKPAWVSFSCKDQQHLNDGSPLKNCIALFKDHPKVFAIGANCTHPDAISGIIKQIKAGAPNKKIIVYPNSGEAYNADSKTWLGLSDPASFVEMTKEWIGLGADILGGCCRIGPEHIRRISKITGKER